MTNQALEALLRDAVDLHVHAAPCLFPRWGNDLQLAREAAANGMRAILIKSHFESTVGRAGNVGQAHSVKVLGGLVLNPFLGGLDPAVVEVGCRLGARMVWMPTLQSVPATSSQVDLDLLKIRDRFSLPRSGDGMEDLQNVVAILRDYRVALATGHLHPRDGLYLLKLCREKGLTRLVFTHPFSTLIEAGDEDITHAVALGAKVELEAFTFVYGDNAALVARAAGMIRRLGAQHFFLSSDGGQAGYPNPCASLQALCRLLYQAGVHLRDLELMTRIVPAELVGLG